MESYNINDRALKLDTIYALFCPMEIVIGTILQNFEMIVFSLEGERERERNAILLILVYIYNVTWVQVIFLNYFSFIIVPEITRSNQIDYLSRSHNVKQKSNLRFFKNFAHSINR